MHQELDVLARARSSTPRTRGPGKVRSAGTMSSVLRVLTAVMVGVMVLAGTATAAHAANPTKRCGPAPPGHTVLGCQLLIGGFPGGTMAIDVDADGSGTGHWILLQHGAWRSCETSYDLRAPAQSWVCHNLPADNYVLLNYAQDTTTWHELGARW